MQKLKKKAVLTNFEPEIRDGVHNSFFSNAANKQMYTFTMTFDNGDTGQARSPFQQPKWQKGKEYEYNHVTKDNGYVEIQGMKDPDYVPGGRGGGKKYNPEEQARISRASCAVRAVAFYEKVDKNAGILETANGFMNWANERGANDRSKSISALSALSTAIDQVGASATEVKSYDNVITKANIWFNYITTGNPNG